MELTAEQQTQAAQLSNALPWIYPGASNADFWSDYFSGSGPSLTPAEQASGISLGPMTPAPAPAPAPQPQVLPGIDSTSQPALPGQYQSDLIRSLREASPGLETNNPGVSLLANSKNGNPLKFNLSSQTSGFANNPPILSLTTVPSGGGGGGNGGGTGNGGGGGAGGLPPGGGGGGGIVIGPSVGPSGPNVPNYDDDLWPPVEEPVAESFPVSDPGPADAVDLPPLDPVAESFPVPDRDIPDFIDLPPLETQDEVEIPDYNEDMWPPVYDEIPEGEIEVGPPGDTSRARGPLRDSGDIGEPLDEWDWVELDEPEIPLPEIPAANFGDLNFSDAELMDMLFGDFGFGGGGGGGLGGSMNMLVPE